MPLCGVIWPFISFWGHAMDLGRSRSQSKSHSQVTLPPLRSFIVLGQASNYIVASTDGSSLLRCIELRLPCFNASSELLGTRGAAAHKSNQKLGISSPRYQRVVWGKVFLAQSILKLGYRCVTQKDHQEEGGEA